MERRELLRLAAAAAAGLAATQVADALPAAIPVPAAIPIPAAIPVIDTHIHLFDTSRPGGVPWPPVDDKALYKPALPDRYKKVAAPFGVVGAIVIEASPLASDNDWVLRAAADHPIIVGIIGDLIPGAPRYQKELERLRGNPLFLGIRYGNLWNRDLGVDAKKPEFLAGLKMLAGHGLVLDSANPDLALLRAIRGVADRAPELRIVIDHLPSAVVPSEPAAREEYWGLLRHLAKDRNVFVKLSEVIAGRIEQNRGTDFCKETLDKLWEVFGEDHVLYASDWPNSDHHATYAETISVVRDYVRGKSRVAQEKFFWRNSLTAYRWQRREPNQPVG